jgi:hypothetical protein
VIGKTGLEKIPEVRREYADAMSAFKAVTRMDMDGFKEVKIIGPDGAEWERSRLTHHVKDGPG